MPPKKASPKSTKKGSASPAPKNNNKKTSAKASPKPAAKKASPVSKKSPKSPKGIKKASVTSSESDEDEHKKKTSAATRSKSATKTKSASGNTPASESKKKQTPKSSGKKRKTRDDEDDEEDESSSSDDDEKVVSLSPESERAPTPLFMSPELQEKQSPSRNRTSASESKSPAKRAGIRGRPSDIVRNAVQQSLAARRSQNISTSNLDSASAAPGQQVEGRASAKFATPVRASGRPSQMVHNFREQTPPPDILTAIRGSLSVVGDPSAGECKIELEPFVTGTAALATSGWKGTFNALPMRGVDGSGDTKVLTALVSVLLPKELASTVVTEQHENYED